jgi:uncharacterized protein (DUF1330 family)
MMKALIKLGVEGMYLNIKAIYDKHTANFILNGGKPETISSKVRNEMRVLTFPTFIQYSLEIPSQSNKAGRRNKRNTKR